LRKQAFELKKNEALLIWMLALECLDAILDTSP